MKIFVLRNVGTGRLHYGESAHFISFDENGRGSKFEEGAIIGGSVILDLDSIGNFSWMTSCITEILENTSEHKHFKTQNSEYMLTKATIKNETISNGKGHN